VGQLPAQLSVLAGIADRKGDPDIKQFVQLAKEGPQDQQADSQSERPEQ